MTVFRNIIPLVSLSLIWAASYYMLKKTMETGKAPSIRKIPALDTFSELIGRAVEMGKPVLFSPSDGATLRGTNATETQAALSIISYGIEIAAKLGAKTIVVAGSSESAQVIPILVEEVKSAYIAAGSEELFDPSIVRYISGDRMSFAAGTMGVILREEVAGCVFIGPWRGGFLPISLAAASSGAMQIGGTTRVVMMPMFVAFCDNLLLGEEVYAAGAYLSQDPSQISTIFASDLGKLSAMILILLGTISNILGFDIISLLKM